MIDLTQIMNSGSSDITKWWNLEWAISKPLLALIIAPILVFLVIYLFNNKKEKIRFTTFIFTLIAIDILMLLLFPYIGVWTQ